MMVLVVSWDSWSVSGRVRHSFLFALKLVHITLVTFLSRLAVTVCTRMAAMAFFSGLCACRCRVSTDAVARPSPSYALVLSWPCRATVSCAGAGQCLGSRHRIDMALFSPSNPATIESLAVFPASLRACPCRDVIAPLASRRALTSRGGLRLALFRCRRHCPPR